MGVGRMKSVDSEDLFGEPDAGVYAMRGARLSRNAPRWPACAGPC